MEKMNSLEHDAGVGRLDYPAGVKRQMPLCEFCGCSLTAHWFNEKTEREVCADIPGCPCDGRSVGAISTELVNQIARIEIEYGYVLPTEFTDAMLANVEILARFAHTNSHSVSVQKKVS